MTTASEPRTRTGVERRRLGDGERRQAPVPAGPELEIVVGAGDGPFGVLDVTMPVGGAMPEHDHGASEVLLVPRAGSLRLVEAEGTRRVTELEPGVLATIPVGCRVRLENAGSEEARVLVVLSPPDFAAKIEGWPPTDAG